jgi:spore coat protein U-like protein
VATGSAATTAAREVGTIPQASKYVVSELYTTALNTVVIDAKADTSGTTAKGPDVKGTKRTQPRALPATGVPSGLPLGVGLLAGAVVGALILRRPRRRWAT